VRATSKFMRVLMGGAALREERGRVRSLFMRYKAVCEELWSITSGGLSACCIFERKDKQPLGDSNLPLDEGREPRGMRDNNKNRRPRSEARKHMGLRTHVPAGISLTVARLYCSLAECKCAPRRRGLEG